MFLTFVMLFVAGFAAGTVDAITGSGGLISLPVLLGIGLPPPQALGTNKLQASVGTFVAAYNYYNHGFISLKVIFRGLIFGFIGASCGVYLIQILSSSLLGMIIPVLMVVILLYTIFSPKLGFYEYPPKIDEAFFYMSFGFLLGFYDGFFGPGTGSLWVISLVFFLGYSLPKATAYTKVFNLKSNIFATLFFVINSNINYEFAFVMAAGQIIGGKLGSKLVIKNGAQFIRPIFLVVVIISVIILFYKYYFSSNVSSGWML